MSDPTQKECHGLGARSRWILSLGRGRTPLERDLSELWWAHFNESDDRWALRYQTGLGGPAVFRPHGSRGLFPVGSVQREFLVGSPWRDRPWGVCCGGAVDRHLGRPKGRAEVQTVISVIV